MKTFNKLIMLYDYCLECSLNDSKCEYFGVFDNESYCYLYAKYLKPLSFRVKL